MKFQTVIAMFFAALLIACSSGGGDDSGGTPAPSGPPAAPAGVAITVQPTSFSVHLNAVAGATGYRVYYSDQPDVDTQDSRVDAASAPIVVAGLTSGTIYYVRVSAVNAAGESDLSQETQARTTAPPEPVETVTATPGDGGLIVSWDPADTATNYTVFASQVPGDISGAVSVETTLTSVAVEGLMNGVTYFVSVRAENIEGDAPLSPETSATPVAGGPGLGWTQQTLINETYDFFGTDNYLGGVGINDAGVAAAVWIFAGSTMGNNFVIANHTASGDWGMEFRLADGDNLTPKVVVMPNGVIVAAWIRYYLDANGFRTGSTVESRRYENGAWTPIETIASIGPASSDYALAVTLAADGQNNVLAAWTQNQTSLWVNRFSGGSWGTPQEQSVSIRSLGPPAIGANAGDEGIVVWLQDTEPYDSGQTAGGPSRRSVFASHFDGAGWTAATRVGHMDLVDWDGAERLNIDVNPLGSAVATWIQSRDNSNDDGFRIDGLRYDAATGLWAAPETIVANDWQTSWPDAAIDAAGNAVASWQPTDLQDNSSTRVLEAAFFDLGSGTWGLPVMVNVDDGETEPDPLHVEMTESGDVFALWQETDGVYWRHYEAAAGAWDPIAPLGIRDGASMAMAMSRNGNVIVVTNPLIVSSNSFRYAVYALQYRP